MSITKLPVVTTDLGLIKVHSRGLRDVVYLAHNNAKAFTITCYESEPSTFQVSKEFYSNDQHQWEQVFAVYVRWKRTQHPGFKLPNHSGRTKTGDPHPWRGKINKEP